MSLTNLWLNSPEQITDKSVAQIIAFAGEGRLRDGSKASDDFRLLLSHLPSAFLERYADECLKTAITDGGFALQDVINEIGVRLGFTVEHGRYKGVVGKVGNDGLWRLPDGYCILVEVKTTDAYRIDLNKIAQYRRSLIVDNSMAAEASSLLVIVGREDTGDLEAQIRGSRHAWEMRLISVDALCRLMKVKEQVEDPVITKRIYEILIPREFTKLDAIIDILFSATEEVQQQDEGDIPPEDLDGQPDQTSTKLTPVAFNDQCISRIEQHLGKKLVKRSKIKFATPDNSLAVVCAVSKVHERYSQPYFWYAFHPHQQEFLESANRSYLALGCGSEANLLLIPFSDFQQWLAGMNITQKDDRFYYHIQVSQENSKFLLVRRKGQPKIDLTKYLLK
ncbi:MAG: hypothetical protein U0105_17655 [Candidatus Obscuribacterales bacterium]